MKTAARKQLRFLIAGDPALAGCIANQIASEGVETKLLTIPDSPAYRSADNSLVHIQPGSAAFRRDLRSAGLLDATHFLLFEESLSVLIRQLEIVNQINENRRKTLPLAIFAQVSPGIRAILRAGAVEFQSRYHARLWSWPDEAAADFILAYFPQQKTKNGDHFILLGETVLAESLALKLARLGAGRDGNPLTIQWIVSPRMAKQFQERYPSLGEVCRCTMHPVDLPLSSSELLAFSRSSGPNSGKTLIVDQTDDNLEVALAVSASADKGGIHQIYLPDWQAEVLTSFFAHQRNRSAASGAIYFFGGLSQTASAARYLEEGIHSLPKAIHELYCQARIDDGEQPAENASLRSWDEIGDDLQTANREQADHIAYKLSLLGYRLDTSASGRPIPPNLFDRNLESMSRLEHARWVAERTMAGWKHGKVRDNKLKLHPMLVSYEELPESEKEKDREAVRAIPRLLAAAGLTVRRV